ncbi:site-specific integrase [Spirosoma endophyticum]|uniref:Site-specific recombinase XerD n=1 Tax=Spirosoma endophyticum TaxID=662367 RepID=A0A1I2GDW7_9BACT|nr:site-specific integrase [Spirosoma endophyticum]SFF15180.1 Site-specific recombinase XerD [Spirosoma endophyticum]
MNTNVVISLDTRRQKKDGTYPLIMRLGHHENTTSIPLGISIGEKDWDEQKRRVKKTYTGVSSITRLNNQIQKVKSDAMDVIFKLHESGVLQTLSITSLKDRITQKDARDSFFQFATQCEEELIKAHRIGTARSYKGLISVLKDYRNGKDLLFKEITYDFLSKFEIHHKSKGNGLNGLSVYMRAIRAIYNKAIKSGLVDREQYPFDDYKIKSAPTEKRALDGDLLKKIIELKLSDSDLCFDTRNYFLASYMMYGMNFADMAYLEKTSIENGRVRYRRRKTGKLYDIKIAPQLETILVHYVQQNTDSKFVFPILKRDSPALREKDIQWARKRYNKKLKMLASLCGIGSNLTSYVSRHSFATQAMLHDIPLTAISTMLGHSSLKTTEIYLKGLPVNILDNYNERILDA